MLQAISVSGWQRGRQYSCLGIHPLVLVRLDSHRPLFSRPSYSPARGTVQVASGQCIWGWFPQQTKSFTVDIRAKPEYHKFLIGKGGGKIRKVRDNTGARIIFPTAEDKDQDLITIIGKEDAVREAQRELEALIQNLVRSSGSCTLVVLSGVVGRVIYFFPPSVVQDNVVEDCMLVDPKHHRHFVIRRGQVLREIAEEYGGVMVSFPRSGTQSDKVTLKGAKDCVEAAKKRIQEIIEDLVGAWEGDGALNPNSQGQGEWLGAP